MKSLRAFGLFAAAVAVVGALSYLGLMPSGDINAFGAMGAMAVVQSTYAEGMTRAVAGMVANMTNYDADTRNCETAAGIGFGKPVGQGTAENGGVLAGPLAGFVGVSVRDVTLVSDTADEYQENDNMAVLTEGDINVVVSVAVLVTDPVHYNATTGAWLITGGEGPIVGARWMKGAGIGGVAVLRLSGHLPVA